MTVHSCLGRWFVDSQRSAVFERGMYHETVLEQTEQEESVKCTDEAQTESTAHPQAKTRAMETAKSSKITAKTSTDVYTAATVKSHEAGHSTAHSKVGASEGSQKVSNGSKRISEKFPQPYYSTERLGYLD